VETFKFVLIMLGYLLMAPALGTVIAFRDSLRRPALGLMLLLTAVPPGWFTLTAWSQDWYRGHARGYQGSIIEIIALGLIIAAVLRRRKELRIAIIPGVAWWFYCSLCLISFINAFDSSFAHMAAFKYFKLGLIPLAVCASVLNKSDILWLLHAMAAGLVLNLFAAIWQRYGLHYYRVNAWFEHSNSMGMWAYMQGAVLLAASTTRALHTRTVQFWIFATLIGGTLTIMSLARGSIAACGLSYATIVLLGLAMRPNLRGAFLTIGMLIAMTGMLAKSYDSILERISSTSEEAGYEDFRPVLVRQAQAMFADYPLGVGWNDYCIANSRPNGEEYSQYFEDWEAGRGSSYREEVYMHNPMVENIYWLHLAEVGWPGTTGYILFLMLPLPFALVGMIRHRKGLIGGFCGGFLIVSLVIYGHGSIERVMMETKNLSAWLIMLGAVIGCACMRVELQEELPPTILDPDSPPTRARIIPSH